MATMSAKGQTYGVNAAGFFENINETSAQYLDEAVGQHPWCSECLVEPLQKWLTPG